VGQIAGYLCTGRLPGKPTASGRLSAAIEHFWAILEIFGREKGLRHARKHLSAYAAHAGRDHAEPLRSRLVTTIDAREVPDLLAMIFETQSDSAEMDQAA
jgi:tRNA-dihydrouridine synthase